MTKAYNLKWTEGNSKLVKTSGDVLRILGFGIPADFDFRTGSASGDTANTCPAAGACRGVCYAKQGRYVMDSVKNARMHNLNLFLNLKVGALGFVAMALEDLKRLGKRYNVVRIHDSGDFFSQKYMDAWKYIAMMNPEIIFYAYTKSLHLDIETNRPANFRIVQSLGGKYDSRVNPNASHARIFSTDADRINAGYVDGSESDMPAIEGVTNIGLVYHGVRKLTEAQKTFFE